MTFRSFNPMNKIVVTPRGITSAGGHASLDRLRASGFEVEFSTPGILPTEEELCQRLPNAIGYLAGVEPITRKVMEHAPHLKVIARNGVGVDNIDLPAAQALGIRVCPAPGSNARGVAELALTLLMNAARAVSYQHQRLAAGQWVRKQGMEIYGKTLGVIGCGRIGKELSLMALALGMKVVAYEVGEPAFFTYHPDFAYVPLAQLLQEADFISLHCPPPADGRALVDTAFIAQLKSTAILINTARGSLIDEPAVLKALNNQKLGHYATDVFVQEPPSELSLYQHSSVTCTPHIGGYTSESTDRAMYEAVHQLLKHLQR
jgi:D-3-phosphoglycerate dehydrogenase